MRKALSSVITRVTDQTEILYECRNCGTNLEPNQTVCTECGDSDIAVYEFSPEE